MAHLNGVPPAPPGVSGAFSSRPTPPRTEFLPDLPPHAWREWCYVLVQQRLGAFSLLRWLVGGLLLLGIFWGLASLPGGWWVALGWLTAALLLLLLRAVAGRSHFLRFRPQALSTPPPAPLGAHVKTPLYVTGILSVEGRRRAFTHLPGFYRTFATREHALLCQARPGRVLGIGALPDDLPGLWYAFFMPQQITRIRTGAVTAGGRTLHALAVTYTAPDQRQRQRSATLFLSFPNPADCLAVLADLRADQAVEQITATP